MEDLIEELKKAIEEVKEPKATVWFRLALITRHLGEVCRDIAYEQRFPKEARAWRADLKINLADLLTQISIMCIELGIDEKEIRRMGIERYKEKAIEHKERGWVEV